jgi:hypothetical protein
MSKPERTKRRILTASAGVVAITAVEGLACGNPVAPRHDMPHEQDTVETAAPIETATPVASSDVSQVSPPPSASALEADAGVSDTDAGTQ